jgi:acyl carrier protein
MTRAEILTHVTAVLARVFDRPDLVVRETTTARDVPEWDSLNHATLITGVEAHFKIKFSLKEIMRFQNVGDMCAAVETKLNKP